MAGSLGPEWHISPEGYDVISQNGNVKDKQLLTSALNTDIKDFGEPVLAKELSRDRTSKLVLQIQKIRNISAPKANEDSQAAPRLLKLSLSDGDTYVQALELAPISSISRNQTPPGSKVLINEAKISGGYLLINPSNCTLLGGKVPALVERWEVAKSVQRTQRRNYGEDGPPPWVSFGNRIQTGNQDGCFKSLGDKTKEPNKGNTEFELQRQGAIAEAASGAIKKVFGGRVKQNVQPVVRSVDRREQSKPARMKMGPKEKDFEEKPLKPSGKVSLFSFLEDKLPSQSVKNETVRDEISKPYDSNFNRNEFNSKPFWDNPRKNQFNQDSSTNYSNNYANNYANNYNNQNNFKPNRDKTKNNKPYNSYKTNSDLVGDKFIKDKVPAPPPVQNVNININDVTPQMDKMSLNSQFASRSLRQHLNLGSPKEKRNDEISNKAPSFNLNVGEECLAKYWEDGKFYNADVVATTDKTVVVKFKGYNNIEEVLKSDCMPVTEKNKWNLQNQSNRRYDQNRRPVSGSMEFRRSTRNYN